ncbi:hypothetical protein VKT23_015951 [Stygiomarasmius scandens]|uniref:Uncharacterized protein n=1 Tax=Marasmiellus scandens TaxID=2682957 RepID=A0ABR1IZ57_9AGAR
MHAKVPSRCRAATSPDAAGQHLSLQLKKTATPITLSPTGALQPHLSPTSSSPQICVACRQPLPPFPNFIPRFMDGHYSDPSAPFWMGTIWKFPRGARSTNSDTTGTSQKANTNDHDDGSRDTSTASTTPTLTKAPTDDHDDGSSDTSTTPTLAHLNPSHCLDTNSLTRKLNELSISSANATPASSLNHDKFNAGSDVVSVSNSVASVEVSPT